MLVVRTAPVPIQFAIIPPRHWANIHLISTYGTYRRYGTYGTSKSMSQRYVK